MQLTGIVEKRRAEARKSGCSHPGKHRVANAGILWCLACGNAIQGQPRAFAALIRDCVRVLGGRR